MTSVRKLVEMMLLFAALLGFDHYLSGTPFVELEPNPYWIPVIAMSLAYGSGMGLAAMGVASVIWVSSTHHWPADYDRIAIQLHLSILPLMWAVCALLIGETTSSRQGRLKSLQQRCTELERDSDKIARTLTSVSKINRDLQVSIATAPYVAGEALMAASRLLIAGQPGQRVAFAKLIALAIGSEDFTYFGVSDKRLVPLLSGASTDYKSDDPLQSHWADAILGQSEIVHIHQKRGRELLEGVGVVAIPVIDPTEAKVVALLVVHSAPALRLNPARIAELRHLGEALFNYGEVFAKPALRLAEPHLAQDRVA